MTNTVRLWICAAHHPAFLCGGWASVRLANGQFVGLAGGERRTTAGRMALKGLASGLKETSEVKGQAADAIAIETTSPELAAWAATLAGLHAPGADTPAAPDQDLDLWAQIIAASRGRRLALARVPLQAGTPAAFVAAWADLAMSKARSAGPFATAIPKANLAKVSWPA